MLFRIELWEAVYAVSHVNYLHDKIHLQTRRCRAFCFHPYNTLYTSNVACKCASNFLRLLVRCTIIFFSDDNKSNYYYLTASANRQNYFYPIITILMLRKFVSRMYWEYSPSTRIFKRMNYQRIKYLQCSKIVEEIRSCKNKFFLYEKLLYLIPFLIPTRFATSLFYLFSIIFLASCFFVILYRTFWVCLTVLHLPLIIYGTFKVDISNLVDR